MPQIPKLVPIKETPKQGNTDQGNLYKLVAKDEKAMRYILKIGPSRVAIDYTVRITKLAPKTGDRPAEVVPLKREDRKT